MFKPLILLGCNGRHKNYVQLCAGTNFPIINLEHLPEQEYATATKYIYETMHLKKGPIRDHNQVINVIQFLISRYLDDEFSAVIYEWINMHKKCGIYIEGT